MDYPPKPPTPELLALAVGLAARIAVRFGLTENQAAELMQSAWHIVQDRECPQGLVSPETPQRQPIAGRQ